MGRRGTFAETNLGPALHDHPLEDCNQKPDTKLRSCKESLSDLGSSLVDRIYVNWMYDSHPTMNKGTP